MTVIFDFIFFKNDSSSDVMYLIHEEIVSASSWCATNKQTLNINKPKF